MKQISYFLMACSALIYFGCSSGKKSYEQGDYIQSVMQSVDRLRKNPDHKKSREVLAQAYPLAVKYYNSQIDRYKMSNDRFKNGEIVDTYRVLNQMSQDIQRCPGALSVIPNPYDYYSEINQYAKQAAAERYTAGEEAMRLNTRQDAKIAYGHFIKADEYSPGYLDVRDKIDEAKYYATLKVRVEQVPVPTLQYQLSVQFFQDQVEQFLFNYHDNEFVRFFSDKDESLKNPDQILVFQLDDFVVGQTNNLQKTTEVSKDSVVMGQVKLENGQSANVYGTVKAKFTENRSEIISKGLLSMRIIDSASNTIVFHEKFPGQFVWASVWGNFNGDERALTPEEIKISNQRPVPPPPPQDLFIEFCKPIYSQIQSKVFGYYRGM